MLKTTLASLVLATSLFACKDSAPQIITLPAPTEVAKPGNMMVTGTATLEVSPDCADLTMTVSADGTRPGKATAALQAKQQELVAALLKLGIETADLKLSHLTLNPIYAPNEEGWAQLRVATYRAEMTITVTTKRFDQIGSIMDAGAQAGVNAMSSAFRRSDLPELKKKVRDMALAAAKDKAAQTAKALSIQLGRVVSVAESPGGVMWNAGYFPQVSNMALRADGGNVAPAIGGTLQPLTLDITIGFELGAKTA